MCLFTACESVVFLWRAVKGSQLAGAGTAGRTALPGGFSLAVFDSLGASVCYLRVGKNPPETSKCRLSRRRTLLCSFFLPLYKKKFSY